MTTGNSSITDVKEEGSELDMDSIDSHCGHSLQKYQVEPGAPVGYLLSLVIGFFLGCMVSMTVWREVIDISIERGYYLDHKKARDVGYSFIKMGETRPR